jgi:hypothetical protein
MEEMEPPEHSRGRKKDYINRLKLYARQLLRFIEELSGSP